MVNRLTNQPVNQPTNQPVNQSTNQPKSDYGRNDVNPPPANHQTR
ncbi:MAG: PT domain-containing protein [Anaerolineae bacterium]